MHNNKILNKICYWISCYRDWRYQTELKKKYPDPFIVCNHARNCSHVDGFSCEPKNCLTRITNKK